MSDAGPAAPGGRDVARPGTWSLRPAFLLWLVLAPLAAAPYVRAARHPPPQRDFSGAFFYQDDYQQYLSFVEQASRGAFLFRNKFDLRPQRPFLVNLAWWAGGVLARPLGGDPRWGYLAVGLLALLGLLAAASRLLRRGGLRGSGLWLGLALFATGGGLGWLRHLQRKQWHEIPDLGTLVFPASQILISTHAIVGTALLLAAVAFFLEWRDGGPRWPWLLCATLLGVTRPYDLAVFGGLAVAWLALDLVRGRPGTPRAALQLMWLAPVLLYDAAVFVFHPSFSAFTGAQNEVSPPPLAEWMWALGPAAALALIPRRERTGGKVGGMLGLGVGVVVALVLLVRLPFTLQLVNALGAFLLLRAALQVPPWLRAPAVIALCPTSAYLVWTLFHPSPAWFPPRDYVQAARELRVRCRDQEVLLAPVDPGLIVAGQAPCSLALGHRVMTPDLARRVEEARTFYSASTPPSWRAGLLRRLDVTYVLLPRGRGGWIDGSGFVPAFVLPGLEAWRRE